MTDAAPTRDQICEQFLDQLTFDLYPYQEEALLTWFEEEGDGIMVCVPTGMGKTLLAEAAVFEALHTRKRLYYTTPLIALTDQKYREMQELVETWGFPRDDVGLITGNRKENADATVVIVVAEILLNHLLTADRRAGYFDNVGAVVMDEFHSFNDPERGIVWELSLVLLPKHVRVLLLSATVGNPREFAVWLHTEHGRKLRVLLSDQRRVPLEFVWVEDKLLTEQLPDMNTDDDETNRTPVLVFSFNRDECWDLAEKLKGLALIGTKEREAVSAYLDEHKDDFTMGVGPKLRQMLLRGVGVHHAGVLPKHKEVVEDLFKRKLVPFVVCTETLAAGINLPARSVMMTTLLKGPRDDKKLIPTATAQQIFGRAGRPQFDTRGFVFAMAHEDDVRINRWKVKYDQIDPKSKDPGLMRARKDLERKKPSRRKNQQYWTEGQLNTLRQAGAAKLASRAMIPYQVLIFLLRRDGTVRHVREFLSKRFNEPGRIEKFQSQLDFMIDNLAALGYLTRETAGDDPDHIIIHDEIARLSNFRSIDPLFGDFLSRTLLRGDENEKLIALEAALQSPPGILRKIPVPDSIPKGPLQTQILEPMLTALGVRLAPTAPPEENDEPRRDDRDDPWAEEEEERPPDFAGMLKIAFESKLASPEDVFMQPKWIAGDLFQMEFDFYKFVAARNLVKQEGLILRHLLRLTILAGEFRTLTEDPEYDRIADNCAACCRRVDPAYTEGYLAEAEEARRLARVEVG